MCGVGQCRVRGKRKRYTSPAVCLNPSSTPISNPTSVLPLRLCLPKLSERTRRSAAALWRFPETTTWKTVLKGTYSQGLWPAGLQMTLAHEKCPGLGNLKWAQIRPDHQAEIFQEPSGTHTLFKKQHIKWKDAQDLSWLQNAHKRRRGVPWLQSSKSLKRVSAQEGSQ